MAGDLISDSDNIIRAAGQSLADQRAGGRRVQSVGRASFKMKMKHLTRKVVFIFGAIVAILIGSSIIGSIIGGLGFTGVMLTVLALVVTTLVLGMYPKIKVPRREDLMSDNVKQLVGRTELWLEHQRPALPPPAAKLVNGIGLQLDELQLQLEEVDQKHPTAMQIRKLVGEDLPEMVEGYQRIPEKLRYEQRAGSTPAKQLEEGLNVVSREIDSITRQLAEGSLDDLAIRTRYLDYKYGEAERLAPPKTD